MEPRTKVIPVKITETLTVMVEARALGGEEDVSNKLLSFEPVTEAIEAIANQIGSTVEKIKPDKVTIEFGLEISVKSGQLVTLLVNGEQKGNLKISMEWGNKP
jgi:Trypsin-co-occurring domain 1